jgi:GT2 family glycosyltransferase
MEEIDLCWRLNRAGHKIYYCGASTVFHVGGGTLSKANPRKTQLNFRNCLSLLIKHLPLSALWWKLPLRLTLDWLAAMLFLLRGAPADAWAVLKAHFDFLWRIKKDLSKRNDFEKRFPNYRISEVYGGLLPYQHFVLKHKTVRELSGVNNPR